MKVNNLQGLNEDYLAETCLSKLTTVVFNFVNVFTAIFYLFYFFIYLFIYFFENLYEGHMMPDWPKLASLVQKTYFFSCFLVLWFSLCVFTVMFHGS